MRPPSRLVGFVQPRRPDRVAAQRCAAQPLNRMQGTERALGRGGARTRERAAFRCAHGERLAEAKPMSATSSVRSQKLECRRPRFPRRRFIAHAAVARAAAAPPSAAPLPPRLRRGRWARLRTDTAPGKLARLAVAHSRLRPWATSLVSACGTRPAWRAPAVWLSEGQ